MSRHIDATDTASGHGVYNQTGTTLTYTTYFDLPWHPDGGMTIAITLHEYKQVSGDRVKSIRPYQPGDLIELNIPLGTDEGCFRGIFRITGISDSNELTLERLFVYQPRDVKLLDP